MAVINQCHISSGHLLPSNNVLKLTRIVPATGFGRYYRARFLSQRAKLPTPTVQACTNVKKMEEVGVDGTGKVKVLKQKMRQLGINPDDSCIPGFFSLLLCPKCQGGRQNGALVGCKYRTLEKRFWQDKGTEKWLYGIDDLKAATEAIIVEGEIDKLSVEEAGFRNCVSVPCGAPQAVSAKDLPSLEKDKAYQYLWNGKEYLEKISRIILATDSDTSGQSLAEELARRLGKDRCWFVRWPMKDYSSRFNDANEVLRCLGAVALKEAIESAELYQAS